MKKSIKTNPIIKTANKGAAGRFGTGHASKKKVVKKLLK